MKSLTYWPKRHALAAAVSTATMKTALQAQTQSDPQRVELEALIVALVIAYRPKWYG